MEVSNQTHAPPDFPVKNNTRYSMDGKLLPHGKTEGGRERIIPIPAWHQKLFYPMLIKVQLDATVFRHLFIATSLYMFRVSRTHHQEY